MVFTTNVFFYAFFPIAILLFYVFPPRLRAIPLLFLSIFFYAWGEPLLVLLILASALINFRVGKVLEKHKRNKPILIVGILLNLIPLVFLKYSNFILESFGFGQLAKDLDLPLPIGVSFYTFMAIGYLVDIYRRSDSGSNSLLKFSAYLTMYPHLVAGPIVRWEHIGPQLTAPKFDSKLFGYGAVRVVTGIAKKVLIADQLAVAADSLFGLSESPSVAAAWITLIVYSLQIYLDFSAYSDIAIGLAAMLGIRFHENFNFPYLAKSASDFWRRWHISLGTWFRDYIYIPLGGSRVSKIKLWRNLMVVWALTGLWHGASWTFMAWGIYFGVLIGLERTVYGSWLEKRPAFIQHLYGVLAAGIGWIIFRSTSFAQAKDIISSLFPFGGKALTDPLTSFIIEQNFVLICIAVLLAAGISRPFMNHLEVFVKTPDATLTRTQLVSWVVVLVALIFVSTAYMVSVSYQPFIYFRF
jgi:alginate O-acetyltransferase complex protein AlgI